MPIERDADHPRFELGGNTITSYAAPARGAYEAALFRIDLPPGGALPRHQHDHLDVFAVEAGGGTLRIDDETFHLATGDAAVVPVGAWHVFQAAAEGASLMVTMLAGNRMIRDDGSVAVPPWVQ